MIKILRKEDCVGCGACVDVCYRHAISWKIDDEGFWYPDTDLYKCTDCGLCETVCPVINSEKLNKTNIDAPAVYAAYHKDPKTRFSSTSGGLYSAFAEQMIEQQGYIGGAVWTHNLQAKQIVSNKPEDLIRLRGSKYFQSDSTGLFIEIKSLLNKGEKVLICGCPCQMAAIRSYLKKDYPNLLILDFICNSINSPKVFKKYIKNLESQYGSRVISYHPKSKEYGGWHNFAFKATFEDGQVYAKKKTDDDFTHCFIGSHVAARPCCFECRFKKIPRVADITIADFWGIEKINPEMDSPNGTSLVIINNSKGENFFEQIKDKIIYTKQTLEEASYSNLNLYRNIPPSAVDRKIFFNLLNYNGFSEAVKYSRSCLPVVSYKQKIMSYLRGLVNHFRK